MTTQHDRLDTLAASLALATGGSDIAWRRCILAAISAHNPASLPYWQTLCSVPAARHYVLRERGIRAVIVASESLPPDAATLCHSDACRLARFHSGQCETAGASGECR